MLNLKEKTQTKVPKPSKFCSMRGWACKRFFRQGYGEHLCQSSLAQQSLVFMIDTAVTEPENTNLVISFLVFLIITILILATAPVSCGHINPVASFAATLMGLISPARATVYIVAQCAGATLGALAVKAVVDDNIEHIISLGGCTLTRVDANSGEGSVGIALSTALLLEIICTLAFLFGSISIAFDHRQAQAHGLVVINVIVGALMGVLTFVSMTVMAKRGYSGSGMNPAKCIGPALVRGGHLWDNHWVFWVGPAISCLIFYVYNKIIRDPYMLVREYKYDFFTTVKVLFLTRGK